MVGVMFMFMISLMIRVFSAMMDAPLVIQMILDF